MTELVPILIFCQALGAIVGAVAAVWSEVAYIRAMRDGNIDIAERRHLHGIANGLRFGMTLLLLASLALVTVAYTKHAVLQPALTSSYWILVVLTLLVIYVSWALSRRRIPFALGSAIAFTGWWFLVYLTLGQLPPLTFGAAIGFFIVAAAIFYAVLHYIRFLTASKQG